MSHFKIYFSAFQAFILFYCLQSVLTIEMWWRQSLDSRIPVLLLWLHWHRRFVDNLVAIWWQNSSSFWEMCSTTHIGIVWLAHHGNNNNNMWVCPIKRASFCGYVNWCLEPANTTAVVSGLYSPQIQQKIWANAHQMKAYSSSGSVV